MNGELSSRVHSRSHVGGIVRPTTKTEHLVFLGLGCSKDRTSPNQTQNEKNQEFFFFFAKMGLGSGRSESDLYSASRYLGLTLEKSGWRVSDALCVPSITVGPEPEDEEDDEEFEENVS